MVPDVSLGWMHAYRDLTPARTLTFEATSASFIVLGVPLDQDEAVIDAGLTIHATPTLLLNLGYEGMLSQHVRDNGLRANLSWAF